jgi:hypothetical protein
VSVFRNNCARKDYKDTHGYTQQGDNSKRTEQQKTYQAEAASKYQSCVHKAIKIDALGSILDSINSNCMHAYRGRSQDDNIEKTLKRSILCETLWHYKG